MDAYPVRPELAGLVPQNGQIFSWDLPFPLASTVSAWIEFGILAALFLLALVATVAALIVAAKKARKAAKGANTEDILTVVAASIATGVSAQGMWQFAGDVLGFDGPLRLLLFAFIEVAVITSAVRARRNMRENYSAGIDGLAVWVLTCLSAVLSAMDAASVAEAVFRLAAPLVAAWLWERGMAIERVRLTGRGRIHWRLTPERVLVRLGLAEPSERTASEVDAARRYVRVALAADRLAETGPKSPLRWWRRKALKRRGRQMVANTAIVTDESQRLILLNQRDALRSIESLAERSSTDFWASSDRPDPAAPELDERPAIPSTPPVEPERTKRLKVVRWQGPKKVGSRGRAIAAAAYRIALKKGARLSHADLATIAQISTRQAGYAVADVIREEEEMARSADPMHGADLADPVEFTKVPALNGAS